MKSPFWAQVPSTYQAIRTVPVRSLGPHYAEIAYFAGMHDMSTEAVYLARIDIEKRNATSRRAIKNISSGKYDPGSLYIVDRQYEKQARHGAHTERESGGLDRRLLGRGTELEVPPAMPRSRRPGPLRLLGHLRRILTSSAGYFTYS
jgi:hypothetical protein